MVVGTHDLICQLRVVIDKSIQTSFDHRVYALREALQMQRSGNVRQTRLLYQVTGYIKCQISDTLQLVVNFQCRQKQA